jgi:protein SCO1/2
VKTAAALATVLAIAISAVFHVTLGFRALTSEGVRRIRVAQAPLPVSTLALLDAAGERRSLWRADPQVRAWLVTFIYTRCVSVCSALGSEFEQLQAGISSADGVRLASVSFDRAHDSPAALAAYAKRNHADPGRWLVAVPQTQAGLARLLKEMGVVAIDDGAGGYAHNAAIHVVTPSGRLVALFDLERHDEALAFARRLER